MIGLLWYQPWCREAGEALSGPGPSAGDPTGAGTADGRHSPQAPAGYVFLFFYRLERRVLLDTLSGDPAAGAELPQIRAEVVRLLSVYGSNRSFHGYGSEFLEVIDLMVTSHGRVEDDLRAEPRGADAQPGVPGDIARRPPKAVPQKAVNQQSGLAAA
jgi:TerB N-terminal domain